MKTKENSHNDECKIHGKSSRTVNITLLFLVLAALTLVTWHVFVYGPTGHISDSVSAQKPFFTQLGAEIWDLIFSGHGIVAELKEVFVYFLAGVLLAGLIRTYKLAIKLRNSLIRYGFLSIFLASLVGVLTPLCACGILTTAITLVFAGLPLAPVMALLVSSPLISPSAYLLTLNDLGPHWTVIRTIAAFSMGIFAGVITHLIRNRGFQTDTLLIEGAIPRGDFHDQSYPEDTLRCNCKEKFGNRVARKTDNKFIIFWAKSYDMLWLVGKYVLVGVAIGAVIERYIPSDWIHNMFGREGRFNIVWITLGTVPIFLHQISASSILYHIKSTLDGTLSGGAGLAFLIGGPVTAIPTMIMLWSIFKKRVFFLYMFICIVGTIMLSYSFQYLVFVPGVDTDNPVLRGVTSISGGSSAIITKADKNVKIVMAPGGKNIIATYDNDIEGKGGIVFDSGIERFMNGSTGKYDNHTYIINIAEWLEEHNSSIKERNILIYDTFSKSGIEKNAPVILEQGGLFRITITDREETPELSGELLEKYSQLWIFIGGQGPEDSLSDSELETISTFTEEGSSMLIVSGIASDAGVKVWADANLLSSRFGVIFSGSVENKDELRVSEVSYVFDRISVVFARMYSFMT